MPGPFEAGDDGSILVTGYRIMARHFLKNPASGRVMQKIGKEYEGRMRERFCNWGEYQGIELYDILRREWDVIRAGRS